MADLFILALTVFTFQNNTKIAINIYLLDIFALFLVFSYQFTAKCLSLPPPLLGGAISKPLTLPFALAFRTSNIETVSGIFFAVIRKQCCKITLTHWSKINTSVGDGCFDPTKVEAN